MNEWKLQRSADSRTCVVRRTCNNFGDGCFAAAGPRLWKSLPSGIRKTSIGYKQFKPLLKTFVWALRSRRIVTICFNCAFRNFTLLTYLLLTYAVMHTHSVTIRLQYAARIYSSQLLKVYIPPFWKVFTNFISPLRGSSAKLTGFESQQYEQSCINLSHVGLDVYLVGRLQSWEHVTTKNCVPYHEAE